MVPMVSITETDYFITGTRWHGVRIRACIRLLRRMWRRRRLMAKMRRELADPRLPCRFGATKARTSTEEVTAMARALGGRWVAEPRKMRH